MATVKKIRIQIDTEVTLTLNELELRALDALAGYGIDGFLDVFYARMGRAYLEPHEAGLRSLFDAVRGCSGLARDADECREFLRHTAAGHVPKIKPV